jgi:hypothetical protein
VDDRDTRADLIARIDRERAFWRELTDEVGRDRMTEPGPMGEWTFKDLAAHLLGWRERMIARLEAAAEGREEPNPKWPAELDGDDRINDWIQAQYQDRSVEDVLDQVDRTYVRVAAAVTALPDAMLIDPAAFRWLEGESLAEADLFGHLHDEHLPSIRDWLAARPAVPTVR